MQAEAFFFQPSDKMMSDGSGHGAVRSQPKNGKTGSTCGKDDSDVKDNEFSKTVNQILKEQEDQVGYGREERVSEEKNSKDPDICNGIDLNKIAFIDEKDADLHRVLLQDDAAKEKAAADQLAALLESASEKGLGQNEIITDNTAPLMVTGTIKPVQEKGMPSGETSLFEVRPENNRPDDSLMGQKAAIPVFDDQGNVLKIKSKDAIAQPVLTDSSKVEKTEGKPVWIEPVLSDHSKAEKSEGLSESKNLNPEKAVLQAGSRSGTDSGFESQHQNRSSDGNINDSNLFKNVETEAKDQSIFEKSGKVLYSGQQSKEVEEAQNMVAKSGAGEIQTDKPPAFEIGQKLDMPAKINIETMMPKEVHQAIKAEAASPEAKQIQTSVMNQIVEKAILKTDRSRPEMTIKLKPDVLGNVKMNIMTDKQQVMVRLITDVPAVKEIIESNLGQLRVELQNQGLEIDKFDVLVSQDEQDGNRENSQHLSQNAFKDSRHRNETHHDDAPVESEAVKEEDLENEGIDYFA